MSAAAKKDLNYYLNHTDEMPTDPKEIEALANEHMDAALNAGTEVMNVDKIVGKADEPEGAAAAKEVADEPAKAEPAKAEEAKPEAEKPEGEVKPEGILAKDGKNVIPYSQLESARQRAAAAEALAREQAQELATLRAAKAAPTEQVTDAEMLSDEELSALEADSPTLAKTLRAQQAAIRNLREIVGNVAQNQASQAASEAEVVKSEIQTAIDANPMLAAWQTSEDQTLWNEASRIDRALRESPKYANVSFADRFKTVVEMTRVAMGLPAETPAASAEEAPAPTQEEIKAAAQAKLAESSKGKRPVSLSDVPGGAPPAVDERQKVEDMSPVALGQQFLSMNKEQLETYLASL